MARVVASGKAHPSQGEDGKEEDGAHRQAVAKRGDHHLEHGRR